MYKNSLRPSPHSRRNNPNENQNRNQKIVAWQEARVFAEILKRIVNKRFERTLLLFRLTPKKHIKKLLVLERLYLRKMKIYLYDIIQELVTCGRSSNQKQLLRVNIPAIFTQKIQKIYSLKLEGAILKIKHKAMQNKLRQKAIERINQNIRRMSPKNQQQQCLDRLIKKYNAKKLLATHYDNLEIIVKTILMRNMRSGFNYIEIQALHRQITEEKQQQKLRKSEYNESKIIRSELIKKEKNSLADLKKRIDQIEMEKYQKQGQIKRNKALKQVQKRSNLRQQTRNEENLQKLSDQYHKYYHSLVEIRQNRKRLAQQSTKQSGAHSKVQKLYYRLADEIEQEGTIRKYQLLSEKLRYYNTSTLQNFAQYHIHEGLKLNQLICQFQQIQPNNIDQSTDYQQAHTQNTQLKKLLNLFIRYQFMRTQKQTMDLSSKQLQEEFQQFFMHLQQNQSTQVKTRSERGFQRKQTGRTSIVSLVSEKNN